MPYLWFAIGYIGYFLLDALLNDARDDEDDDEGGGGQPPHRPGPVMGGDSAPVSVEELHLSSEP